MFNKFLTKNLRQINGFLQMLDLKNYSNTQLGVSDELIFFSGKYETMQDIT